MEQEKYSIAHYVILLFFVVLAPNIAIADSLVDAEFKTGKFNWDYWCPAYMDMVNAPVEYFPDTGGGSDFYATITANNGSLGGNKWRPGECTKPMASSSALTSTDADILKTAEQTTGENELETEYLGESFFADQSIFPALPQSESFLKSTPLNKIAKTQKNPYCTKAKLKQALEKNEEPEYAQDGICMQRQEQRFQSKFRHPNNVAHSYSIKFRMPAVINNRTDSLRWVLAQWKYKIDKKVYGSSSASPFLAMRFDDGVHHITVQDEYCRCMVASAPHPIASKNRSWKSGTSKYCRARKNIKCKPAFKVDYGANPVLTPPLGNWVTMDIQVQASRTNAQIIISENGRKIVRVYGKIGYFPDLSKKNNVKFKIGHYRTYQDSEDKMDIDWVKVSKI